jgi:hypothetical protein
MQPHKSETEIPYQKVADKTMTAALPASGGDADERLPYLRR